MLPIVNKTQDMKYFLALFTLLLFKTAGAQNVDEAKIKRILTLQATAWNRGDIKGYMQAGYWNNDSLIFVGENGPTYGFKATLERYKMSYSDTTKMGKLYFSDLKMKPISGGCYFVIGRWELKRSVGDL